VLRGDREHRWRCASPDVAIEDLARPRHRVADADPRGLRACPQLEVLRAAVVADAVEVVDGLPFQQLTAEELLGYQDVLEDVAEAGARMIGHAHHHVARLVPGASSPPVTVGLPGDGAAGPAGGGLDLLGVAAGAEIPGSARRATPVVAAGLEPPSALSALPLRHAPEAYGGGATPTEASFGGRT
jgi:hypothetical protein